jgi:hypothetical protein
VGAKNPRKWGNFFDFRAAFVEPPQSGSTMPAVRITLPDGTIATSGEDDLERTLSRALGREVTFEEAQLRAAGAKAEEYWPGMEGLDYRDTVTDFELPEGCGVRKSGSPVDRMGDGRVGWLVESCCRHRPLGGSARALVGLLPRAPVSCSSRHFVSGRLSSRSWRSSCCAMSSGCSVVSSLGRS